MPLYKLTKTSPIYHKLKRLLKNVCDAREAANKLVVQLGGTSKEYISESLNMNTGIIGIKFKKCPAGWRQTHGHEGYYFPDVNNKKCLALINELPIILLHTITELIGYKKQFIGTTTYHCPEIIKMKNYVVIKVREALEFSPDKEDMEPITIEEYTNLLSKSKYSKFFPPVYSLAKNAARNSILIES